VALRHPSLSGAAKLSTRRGRNFALIGRVIRKKNYKNKKITKSEEISPIGPAAALYQNCINITSFGVFGVPTFAVIQKVENLRYAAVSSSISAVPQDTNFLGTPLQLATLT
jgi:hypothetical protein